MTDAFKFYMVRTLRTKGAVSSRWYTQSTHDTVAEAIAAALAFYDIWTRTIRVQDQNEAIHYTFPHPKKPRGPMTRAVAQRISELLTSDPDQILHRIMREFRVSETEAQQLLCQAKKKFARRREA